MITNIFDGVVWMGLGVLGDASIRVYSSIGCGFLSGWEGVRSVDAEWTGFGIMQGRKDTMDERETSHCCHTHTVTPTN